MASTQKLFSGNVCIIERVQLPKRDREAKPKWEALQAVEIKGEDEAPPALCIQLEFLLNQLNAMSNDAANLAMLASVSSCLLSSIMA